MHTHTHMHAHVYTHTHTDIYTHTHTHTHTYTHTHTHTLHLWPCVYITTFFIHTYRQGNAYKHALTHRCTVAHICHNNTSIVDIQLTNIRIQHIQTLPILNKSSCYIYNAQSLITLRNTLTQRKYTQANTTEEVSPLIVFFLDNALHFISARVGCFPPVNIRDLCSPPPPLIGLSEKRHQL